MSIKDLFDNNLDTNKLAPGSKKDSFSEAESGENVHQKREDQERFVPHIDYSEPANFVTYGSARLYYDSALTRITDYYPYDGSQAEINKFLNESLDIERYILKHKYPSSTGYITLARDGYAVSEVIDDYGVPTTNEYIELKGGPGTGSATSLSMKNLMPSPQDSSYKNSNIYDTDIYKSNNLPSDYGQGTRQSNLRANFDDGVTVEFWMKTGSIHNRNITGRQVIFDAWNNKANTHADYGRLTIELTGTTNLAGGAKDPFIVTIQSGANQPRTIERMIGLGATSLHTNMGDWNHYALRFYNTGSQKQILKSELYINGAFSDSGSFSPYALTHSLELASTSSTGWYVRNDTNRYTSYKRLQGWWKLEDPAGEYVIDWSQNSRTGSYASSSFKPAATTLTPSAYIQSGSATFGGDSTDGINIGDASLWNGIIGTNQTASNSPKMTISARVRKTGNGGTNFGRIIDFGQQDLSLYTNSDNAVLFSARWKSADASSGRVIWKTTSDDVITNDTWEHVLVTYDAAHSGMLPVGSSFSDENSGSMPRLYINGSEKTLELNTGKPTGSFFGIVNQNCVIGNNAQRTTNWEGQIADVAVWDIVLDNNDIKALGHAQDYRQPFTRIPQLNDREMKARIGALITNPISSSAGAGAGRLSGSLDEFRYWKSARTAKQIGHYWFDQVRGGANSDISNANLGVYYKFNEGVTGDAGTDSIVLDYAGRATNGVWTGYGTNSRNTGSAIVSASAAAKEFEDPIIRTNHPDYLNLRSDLHQTGTSYDYTNNASMISMVPGWIQDEESEKENSDLRYIAHVMGAYFDKLKLQIKEISKLKHINYPSSSHKPYPLAEHLPQSLGLYTPELFIDSNVLEKFMNRSKDTLFEADLDETKNIIYHNLYNNLAHIYKTKGTETAVRNVMNVFNIDENVMMLKVKSNNTEYELRNNLVLRKLNKNFLNFNTIENSRAVVYNRSASFSGLDNSAVSGSINGHLNQEPYGLTYEGNFMFPLYDNNRSKLTRDSDYNTISLFGFLQIASGDADREKGTDTTKNEDDQATLKIQAVRESEGSRDAYFRLSSSFATASINFELTSSTVFDLYNNEMWNLSVRVKPKKYPYAPFVSGSGDGTYEVVFSGYNPHAPGQYDSFRLTHDLTGTVAKHLIRARKRPFVGADRSNLTGNVAYPSDVCVSSISYWLKYLNDDDLIQHAFDLENIGTSGSYKAISVLDTSLFGFNPTNADTLVFNWNFRNVTGSDTQGNFVVQDFSSGSATLAERQNLGWVGEISKYQYTGYGYGFGNSSTTVVDRKTVNTYKFIDPEAVVSSDMVQLFSDDDVLFPNLRRTEIVPSYQYSFEKSISNAISEEMLDFFAGAVDFQNIIGRPVNRYRGRYKVMEHLRETFFRRVKEVATVEKFIEYYKWYDEALTKVLQQFMPASADFAAGITNVIESHVLERNKYKSKLNIIDSDSFWRAYEPVIPHIGGGGDDGVTDTSLESYPGSPRPTVKAPGYWDKRAESKQSEITSNNTNIDTQRDHIKSVIYTKPTYSSSAGLPKLTTVGGTRYMSSKYGDRTRSAGVRTMEIEIDQVKKDKTIIRTQRRVHRIKGGRNFKNHNSLDYTLSAVKPNGPVSKEDGVFVPQNVLLAFVSESVPLKDYIDFSWPDNFIRKKTKMFKVQHGRDWEDGIGYKNTKSTFSFPFNIMSASVQVDSGYNREVVQRVGPNLEITNLHIDSYGHLQEVPMQGIFTQDVVGGHQSRHVPLNDGTDAPENRPEAWRILLGTCNEDSEIGIVPTGAIGLVGPDYPPADYNPPAGTLPYPYTPHEKAYLYRDQMAKRPVNIRNINQIKNNKTVLGNYQENYQVFHSFGAYNNPRGLIENQPVLPLNEYTESARYTTNIRTYLDRHRGAQDHQTYIDDYSTSYLTGATNKSVIVCRFSHGPGGPEVETRGFQDFKASEFSVYNSKNYRNLSVTKPSQGPSGSISEPHGGTPTTSRVRDIHGADYGLRSHLSRHTARFGRDPVALKTTPYDLNNNMYIGPARSTYSSGSLQGWWRLNENVSSAGTVADSSGNGITGSFAASNNRPQFSGSVFPNEFIQTGSCAFDGSDDGVNIGHGSMWNTIIGNGTGGTSKMTFAAWIRKVGDGGGSGFGRIFGFGRDLTDAQIAIYTNASEQVYFKTDWNSSSNIWGITNGLFSLNEWVHLVITYDATSTSNDPIFYINGTAQSLVTNASPAGSWNGIATSLNCFVGNDAVGSTGWQGHLADVAVWNTILTSTDVAALYNMSSITNADLITETSPHSPGQTYDQLPGFHKIHRNNREGYTPVYGFTSSIIPDTGLVNSKDVEIDSGGAGVIAIIENSTKRRERVFDAVYADANSDSVLFSYSAWLKPDSSGMKIFELGWTGTSTKPVHALRKESGDELRYYFYTTDGHGTFQQSNYTTDDAVMTGSGWKHVVVTVSGAHGSLPAGGGGGSLGGPTVKIYVNGESKDLTFPGHTCHAYFPTSSEDISNFRGYGTDLTYPVGFFGRLDSISGYEYTGDIDEMSLYSTVLTDAEVETLYNSGAPQNLTQSSMAGSSSILSWWRMGDHPDDDLSLEDETGRSPFSSSAGNIIIDVVNGADLHFTCQRANGVLKAGTGSTSLTGQPPLTRLVEAITGYNKKPLRDNYYVQRPIPQSDRQYRWLSSSVIDVGNSKYSRYQAYGAQQSDRFPFRSSSSGLFTTPYWEFVSASNATTGSFYQPPMLNIIVTDGIVDKGWAHVNPISKELQARYMTLGPGRRDTAADQVLAYGNWTQLNTDLVGVGRPDPSPDYLNQLLTKRGSKYGWGWNKFHQNDHPLLRIQRENNLLVINDSDPDEPAANTAFQLYPVSMKGRTMLINVTGDVAVPGQPAMTPTSMTYRVTNTNENIFFAQPQMNDIANIHFDEIEKSYREVLNFGKTGRFGLNWLLYSQNIFPSLRNEFVSGTERPGYDNLYWRDTWGGAESNTATANKPIPGNTRIALGTSSVTQNSFGAPTISQSSWLLDPLMSFLTRSYIEQYQQSGSYAARRTQRRDYAGELQNTYYRSFMGQPPPYMRIGALYARASAIGTSRSVAAPTGPRIGQTGSLEGYSASFEYAQRVEVLGAGEALWEAPRLAGILVRKNKTAELEFQSEPSVPWWDDYDSFKGDLKLKARGFAVVPEYRISEQMAAYHKNGFDPRRAIKAGNSDGFLEIVGSGQHADSTVDPISSSQVDFYKDYSNSDFLENFLNIEKESLLNAKEIRLSCTGAIRYNAYKGFYPAQRTLDLVNQFSRSFYKALVLSQSVASGDGLWDHWAYGSGIGSNKLSNIEGYMKQLTDPIFSPGILFNSIKAGMAVDYPIVHDGTKMKYAHFGNEEDKSNNWALTITGSTDEATNSGTSAFPIGSASTGYRGGMFWDRRIPFEAIIRPKSFIPDFTYLNMEAHPSMSYMRRTSNNTGITYKYEATASMSDQGDDLYSLMARNFFGEVPSFFLKEGEMTSLESNTVTNDLRFSDGEVYMTRIKLRRSHNGARTYQYEVDSFLRSPSSNGGEIGTGVVGIVGLNSGYGQYGCRSYLSASSSDPTVRINEAGTPILLQDEFPLPQDPKMNPDFRETFTMYSRPSAFGPPVAGRPTGSWATRNIIASGSTNEPKHGVYTASFEKAAFDSFSGFNPAFTPPYTNGEAWVDLIFRPSSSIAYDLERILAETTAVCWRFDSGPPVRRSGSGDFMNTQPVPGIPLLIPVQQLSGTNAGKINEYSPQSDNTVPSPYDGLRINVNSMQLTSSIDIFGVERILEQQTDAKGQKAGRVTNKTVGHKWVIRPKWETPMLNFADSGPHPYGNDGEGKTGANLTLPTYASASVPRGMWHQFGIQPHAPDIGVFMEIGEIPKQWLKNHYMILNTGSVYNNFNVANGRQITRKVKSLSKLCGFNRRNNQVRLGDLKESMTVREAVVAIPYIQVPVPKKRLRRLKRSPKNTKEQTIKKFIEIPKPRWFSAIRNDGTLDTAGPSIRRLSKAMENYVFPPQFDAKHNPRVNPIAMYVFEFEYTFDQDDLSYIWQNLAPRNFKKLQFQSSTVSHNLTNNELINEEILSHDNLRWMVFKVKQRAKSDYYDLLVEQAGGATSKIRERIPRSRKYIAQYNWPYDYLSFVELIKMDVDILFRKDKTVKKKKQ